MDLFVSTIQFDQVMENASTFHQILSRLRYLFWLLVPVLLWLALRSLEFDRVLQTLSSLKVWQIGLPIVSNSLLIFLFGLRWWLLIHRTHQNLAPVQMAGYWLAGFGVDYSTPAPGVGGEPLLAALLHERDGEKACASVAAVALRIGSPFRRPALLGPSIKRMRCFQRSAAQVQVKQQSSDRTILEALEEPGIKETSRSIGVKIRNEDSESHTGTRSEKNLTGPPIHIMPRRFEEE